MQNAFFSFLCPTFRRSFVLFIILFVVFSSGTIPTVNAQQPLACDTANLDFNGFTNPLTDAVLFQCNTGNSLIVSSFTGGNTLSLVASPDYYSIWFATSTSREVGVVPTGVVNVSTSRLHLFLVGPKPNEAHDCMQVENMKFILGNSQLLADVGDTIPNLDLASAPEDYAASSPNTTFHVERTTLRHCEITFTSSVIGQVTDNEHPILLHLRNVTLINTTITITLSRLTSICGASSSTATSRIAPIVLNDTLLDEGSVIIVETASVMTTCDQLLQLENVTANRNSKIEFVDTSGVVTSVVEMGGNINDVRGTSNAQVVHAATVDNHRRVYFDETSSIVLRNRESISPHTFVVNATTNGSCLMYLTSGAEIGNVTVENANVVLGFSQPHPLASTLPIASGMIRLEGMGLENSAHPKSVFTFVDCSVTFSASVSVMFLQLLGNLYDTQFIIRGLRGNFVASADQFVLVYIGIVANNNVAQNLEISMQNTTGTHSSSKSFVLFTFTGMQLTNARLEFEDVTLTHQGNAAANMVHWMANTLLQMAKSRVSMTRVNMLPSNNAQASYVVSKAVLSESEIIFAQQTLTESQRAIAIVETALDRSSITIEDVNVALTVPSGSFDTSVLKGAVEVLRCSFRGSNFTVARSSIAVKDGATTMVAGVAIAGTNLSTNSRITIEDSSINVNNDNNSPQVIAGVVVGLQETTPNTNTLVRLYSRTSLLMTNLTVRVACPMCMSNFEALGELAAKFIPASLYFGSVEAIGGAKINIDDSSFTSHTGRAVGLYVGNSTFSTNAAMTVKNTVMRVESSFFYYASSIAAVQLQVDATSSSFNFLGVTLISNHTHNHTNPKNKTMVQGSFGVFVWNSRFVGSTLLVDRADPLDAASSHSVLQVFGVALETSGVHLMLRNVLSSMSSVKIQNAQLTAETQDKNSAIAAITSSFDQTSLEMTRLNVSNEALDSSNSLCNFGPTATMTNVVVLIQESTIDLIADDSSGILLWEQSSDAESLNTTIVSNSINIVCCTSAATGCGFSDF